MHNALTPTSALLPARVLRYPTPLADRARESTRRLMATHMRSASVELAACTIIFAALGFAAACAI